MDNAAKQRTLPKLLTESQLADLWQCSVRHLANMRVAGLPFLQIGTSIRYDLVEVTEYLKTNRRFCRHTGRQKHGATTEGKPQVAPRLQDFSPRVGFTHVSPASSEQGQEISLKKNASRIDGEADSGMQAEPR